MVSKVAGPPANEAVMTQNQMQEDSRTVDNRTYAQQLHQQQQQHHQEQQPQSQSQQQLEPQTQPHQQSQQELHYSDDQSGKSNSLLDESFSLLLCYELIK